MLLFVIVTGGVHLGAIVCNRDRGGVHLGGIICDCAVTGEVYTWGDNDEGQLGDGSTSAIQKPRHVAALQGFYSFCLIG